MGEDFGILCIHLLHLNSHIRLTRGGKFSFNNVNIEFVCIAFAVKFRHSTFFVIIPEQVYKIILSLQKSLYKAEYNLFAHKGPVQKHFRKKSKNHPHWFCSELSEDSKTVSGLSVRHVLSSQWFFKVDGGSTKISYCCARL